MMKKYILILLSVLCCIGCDREDETVDITVMPPATTIGAETFGCLIDGWYMSEADTGITVIGSALP